MFSYPFPYKICDPIHGFIRIDEIERQVIDSLAFQRLRYIHQTGVAYLVYPGATHTRFDHSLGVMELASRIYDAMMSPHYLAIDQLSVPVPMAAEERFYWRRVLRLAALCHDLGHLPFSHTAEKELLPEGGHEQMTVKLIGSEELKGIWKDIGENAAQDILKLSVSEKELKALGTNLTLSPWEKVLSQVITEDNFGADRIDYLIRDARYTGVGYGHFDYHQLIDSLRIVSDPKSSFPLSLGIAESGIQSVESLWIARYLMYARVYHYSKTKIYSHHMNRFMVRYYNHHFPRVIKEFLRQTDYRILTALDEAVDKGDLDAEILFKRKKPFREINVDADQEAFILPHLQELQNLFGEHLIIDLPNSKKSQTPEKLRDFPVLCEGKKVVPSVQVSQFLRDIPMGRKSLRIFADSDVSSKIDEICHSFQKE